MAQDKKSFILYSDSQGLINQLPDDVAGRLLKHIYAYVNDENPVSEELLINIAFEPIKMQFKRDLKKWEESKDSKSINGKMGNLKRYNTDLYDLVNQNKITLEEAENVAKSRKASQGDSKQSQSVANVAVNDNVNDNVNVINKDNSIEGRKLKFANTIKEFSEIYSREMLNNFYSYWTETNDNGKKFRREMQKTWNLKLRLSKWDSNNTNFNKNKNGQQINDTNEFKQIAQAIGSDGVRR